MTGTTGRAAKDRRADTLRDTRRKLIVEAAKRVFVADGLEAASMRAIAAEAGCTTGALYPLFRGKEEIYAAVLSEQLGALMQAVSDAVAAEGDPAVAARAGLDAFFRYYRERPDELALGLYLFRGLKPAGLTSDLDRALNERLIRVFGLIEGRYARAGDANPRARTAAGIAQAVGLLVLEQTGRLRLFGTPAPGLMAAWLKGPGG